MNNAILYGKIQVSSVQPEVCRGELSVLPTYEGNRGGTLKLIAFKELGAELSGYDGFLAIVIGRLQIAVREEGGLRTYTPEIIARSILPVQQKVPVNTVALVGRTGKEPDIKYFESGKVVANTSLAVNRSRQETDWFNLVVWDKTAQVMADYVRKGKQIGVIGNIQFEYWNDRATGAERSKMTINVSELDLLGSKNDNQQSSNNEPDF